LDITNIIITASCLLIIINQNKIMRKKINC